jgi:hypothetical protein
VKLRVRLQPPIFYQLVVDADSMAIYVGHRYPLWSHHPPERFRESSATIVVDPREKRSPTREVFAWWLLSSLDGCSWEAAVCVGSVQGSLEAQGFVGKE